MAGTCQFRDRYANRSPQRICYLNSVRHVFLVFVVIVVVVVVVYITDDNGDDFNFVFNEFILLFPQSLIDVSVFSNTRYNPQ